MLMGMKKGQVFGQSGASPESPPKELLPESGEPSKTPRVAET